MLADRQYRARIIDDELTELARALPAIALEGAKGVGKTESARRLAASEVRLDNPEDLALARADPARLLALDTPVLLDEWQRLPELWDRVRRAVDGGAAPGTFLLTGSATPANPPTHSGAGRIVTLRMRPLSLAERGLSEPSVSLGALLSDQPAAIEGRTEVGLEDYTTEIISSGFPGIRPLSPRARRAVLDGYLARIVDRDFRDLGREVRRPQRLLRWLRAFAAATATATSYETIRDAATPGEADKLAKSTTAAYRDALERLWILEPLPAWLPSRSQLSRLAKAPKLHLVDPGLAARLLGVSAAALLTGEGTRPTIPRDGTLLGHLFESLATLSLRVYAQAAEARVYHFRTQRNQREVDLIVERADGKVVALEVKLAATVDQADVRHLLWLRGKLGSDLLDAVILTTGREAYRRADGIAVVPLALLGA